MTGDKREVTPGGPDDTASHCSGLGAMAHDVRSVVATHCPACSGTGGTCLAESLNTWLAETAPNAF